MNTPKVFYTLYEPMTDFGQGRKTGGLLAIKLFDDCITHPAFESRRVGEAYCMHLYLKECQVLSNYELIDAELELIWPKRPSCFVLINKEAASHLDNRQWEELRTNLFDFPNELRDLQKL